MRLGNDKSSSAQRHWNSPTAHPRYDGPMPLRLLLSALWFFLVLFSYYVLKPVRDALATETRLFGSLYLATFLAASAVRHWHLASSPIG